MPPGSRWSPTPRTRSRTTASPAAPPSRYSNSGTAPERGVMTNGGLLTTSPNRSPATGSSIEPARTSQSASSRAALNRANASARSDRSVTTTSSACPSRCSAWTPHPVPRSRARSTCGRGVHDARVVEAPPMPSTWFSRRGRRVATSPRSEATHQSTPSEAYGRRSHRATTASPSGSTRPSATAPSTPRVGSAAAASATSTGSPRANSRTRVAPGALEAEVTRCAGIAWSRSRAAVASGPSSSVTPATV